jgi:hypothetical protein
MTPSGHNGDDRQTEQGSSKIEDEVRRPHRPARYADLTAMIDALGVATPIPGEVAASTAAAVLAAARGHGERDGALEPLVQLADTVGIDTLASLWRSAEPASLPGALWTLYLLRQWCRSATREVSLLWQSGLPIATADAVVAGVGMHADEDAILELGDAVLVGAFRGDFGVALERAAGFFRVVAAGRRRLVDEGTAMAEPDHEQQFAGRNDVVASSLAQAAARWRAGTLS